MAMFATIPRNLMVDRHINIHAKILYAYYSMMLVGHKTNNISSAIVEKFVPMTRQMIIRYSTDLRSRYYIHFNYDDFFYKVSFPENVHARIDARVDRVIKKHGARLRKDCKYVANTIVELHATELTKQFEKPYTPKVTDAIMEKVNARLKTYSPKEIIDACENRLRHLEVEEFWNRPENLKFKKNIMNLINTDDKIERWLNIDAAENQTVANTLKGINFER